LVGLEVPTELCDRSSTLVGDSGYVEHLSAVRGDEDQISVGRLDAEQLVVAAVARELDQRRAVILGCPGHVQDQPAVHRDHADQVRTYGFDAEPLVGLIQALELDDRCARIHRTAGHVEDLATVSCAERNPTSSSHFLQRVDAGHGEVGLGLISAHLKAGVVEEEDLVLQV